jgi:hypothetical protein
MFRHIVLFRIRDDVADESVTDAMSELRSLGDHAAISQWSIALSLDTRKGRILIEEGTFTSAAAFEVWRASLRHRRVAEHMAQIADWWVGDRHHEP